MSINLKYPVWGKSLLIFILGFSGLWLVLSEGPVEAESLAKTQTSEAVQEAVEGLDDLPMAEDNSVVALAENTATTSREITDAEAEQAKRIPVVVTAYSSTPWETDDTPFTTASGTEVRDGVVANNLLPFGTRIMIPELYGDKIFTVEDRMHWRKSIYQVDIWFPYTSEAINFGVKSASIMVVD
jgi:3D (Asp-Asp-Asp) domain-containing protein